MNGPAGPTAGQAFSPCLTARLGSLAWMPVAIFLLSCGEFASACPFCESVQQSIRQQSMTMDAVAIASSLDGEASRNLTTGVVKMKVEKVLKGEEHIEAGQNVDAVYYGKVDVGRRFLISGVDPPNLQWSCMPVNERTEPYIVRASQVKNEPETRLRFFMDYLENEEEFISRDAYDEFASTPYEDIRKVEDAMDREQLIEWLKQPELGADRRRLYFTMLGICGGKKDLPMLESMMRESAQNPERNVSAGLDALIACYLTLAGESGLPLVTELFIANKKAPFPQSYNAIMAIRFHGTEGNVIPRSALVESLHHVLDRSELADMVIPDLAKWKDWSQIDRLVQLFKEADEESNWLRVPVINYLRACPLPKAAAAIEELEKIDPDAVRRAKTFFPIPVPVREEPSGESTSRWLPPDASDSTRAANVMGSDMPPAGRLAMASPLIGSGARVPTQPIASASANRLDLCYVLFLATATLALVHVLVLTGGSATGVAPQVAAEG